MRTHNIKDYYYILGLNKNASKDDIKRAYRKLSFKFHPDKNSGDKFFEERFKDINEAHETLVDDVRRKLYDEELSGAAYNYTNANTSETFSPPPQKKKTKSLLFTFLGILLFVSPFLIKLALDKKNEKDSKKSYNTSQNNPVQTSSFDTGNLPVITKADTTSFVPSAENPGVALSLSVMDSSVAGTQNNTTQSTSFSDDDGYVATDYVKHFFSSLNGTDCHSAFYITSNPAWNSRGESWFCSSEAFGSVRKVLIREIYFVTQTFYQAEIYVDYYAEDIYNGNKCFKQNITLQKMPYTDNKSRWRIIKIKNVQEPVICDENQ